MNIPDPHTSKCATNYKIQLTNWDCSARESSIDGSIYESLGGKICFLYSLMEMTLLNYGDHLRVKWD